MMSVDTPLGGGQPGQPDSQREYTPKFWTRAHRVIFWRIIVGLLLFGGWQIASTFGFIEIVFFSRPTDIVARVFTFIISGEVWLHLGITLQEIGYGFAMGALLGLTCGFILGRSEFLADIFEPYLLAFYGIPRIALAPIFIIWLGIGIWSKVAIVFIQVFFLVFVNTYSGMRNIHEEYVLLARVMGSSESLILRRIIIPAAAPFIMMGIRSAVPYSVIGAVVGEFMAANKGLGYYIYRAGATFDSAGAFAGIAVLLTYIVTANFIIQTLEKKTIRWREAGKAQVDV